MALLPTKDQVIAIIRDESMTGSRLRGALGLPKKLKLSFKQMLAEMVREGLLERTCHKEYILGNSEPSPFKKDTSSLPRPAARSRKKIDPVSTISIKRGVLKLVEKDRWIVIESSTGKEFKVAHRKNAPGKDGQTISFTLYPHPKEKHSYLAKVEEHSMSPEITWKEVKDEFMKSSNLPDSFSQEIEEFAASKKSPTAKDFKGRVDYRGLTILCIDPEGARDHDDAVSVERLPGGGFKLGVHIADVSYYVPEGSALDEEALNRSYTQYLPWCAVPMLPERLSGDLCSLHEGVDRCAFTCMMVLNKKGEVQSYEFHRSVINVTSSISYERAVEMKNEGNTAVADLALVSKLLKENRSKSGILELGGTEYQCLFDEKNEPVQIVPRKNDESNSWIEECMLIANNCCAKELVRRQLQGIFRIHEAPDTKDIMELYYLYPDLFKDAPVELRDLGKPRRGDSNLNPIVFSLYQHLVIRAAGDETLINRILRSMQKAHYDSNSFGHFALNWQDYSHFTSPIRRYADLWCHRELARTPKTEKQERKNSVIEVCDWISANEIKNQKTERIAIKVCATYLLKDRIGDIFEATINGIEQWGIYVSVKDPMAEGLVRFKDIAGNDYYIFNPEKGFVFSKRGGKTLRRGDKVEVQLLRVNPLRGEADFALLKKLEDEKTRAPGRRPSKKDRAEVAEELGLLKSVDDFTAEEKRNRTRSTKKTFSRKRR
ncbi:MAG TPA: ribonuclease R [Fibrobacteraceae bacterium]|jgi:ribonuclease R|nr:ribonuclease R [Fibrobacteraceae bacterium]HPW94528.1 ribonuclease R [Fibrobacteraceae bacterium]